MEGAVLLLTKRQRRRDKSVVSDTKPVVKQPYSKIPTMIPKVDDAAMDELVKGI